MPDFTANVLHLGNFSDGIPNIDLDGTGSADNAAALVGMTFTAATNVDVTVRDVNNDGMVEFDGGAGGENITFDLGIGPQTENVNQGVWYDIRIVLKDSTILNTDASIFQTSGGETFLGEFTASLDNLDIASIEVTGVKNNLFARIPVNEISNTTICFAAGTMIATPDGPRRVESLSLAALVQTLDAGPRPITGIIQDARNGAASPVQFDVGSIGNGMPAAPLSVSPQHRILCRSRLAQRMFGVPEVLMPAKRLIGLPGITQRISNERVSYFHIELATHEILFADGAPVESCLMSTETLKSLPPLMQGILRRRGNPHPCRMIASGHKQRAFSRRMLKNRIAPIETRTAQRLQPAEKI